MVPLMAAHGRRFLMIHPTGRAYLAARLNPHFHLRRNRLCCLHLCRELVLLDDFDDLSICLLATPSSLDKQTDIRPMPAESSNSASMCELLIPVLASSVSISAIKRRQSLFSAKPMR
jgi:hypothetical protein